MLEQILGSGTKIKVLRLLLREPMREFSIQDVARSLGLSLGSVHPAVQQLLDARFVLTRRVGRSRGYRANDAHPLFRPLKSLIEAEVGQVAAIAKEFADALPRGVQAVVLFGSVARGRPAARSDVDVLVVTDDPSAKSAARRVAASMLDRHDVDVSPLVLGPDEVAARLRAFDPLLLTIAQEGRLLRGRARWLAR